MRTLTMSDRGGRLDRLRMAGLVCVYGLAASAGALLVHIVFPSTPRWPLSLMFLFLIAPSFIAEVHIRARPAEAKKRLWGYPTFWGTMGLFESFSYLLHADERSSTTLAAGEPKRHAGA